MFLLMALWGLIYVALLYFAAKRYALASNSEYAVQLKDVQLKFLATNDEKERISCERRSLEKQASEIFMLYEMTKEITKKLNEQEAFKIFKEKLKESVDFTECLFAGVGSKEYPALENDQSGFKFLLKSKREQLGLLVIRGLKDTDNNKVTILGHQFALALRRIMLYQEVEKLAITDSLTGVHTRRHYLERLEEELKRSAIRKVDLSILMIDADYFKSFNDTYGHLVGDQILRSIGNIIKENIREIDFAGRYGGEEFCVALPVTDRYGASFAAERIRLAIDETAIKAYDANVHVTVSIGIASFPADGAKINELLDKADWALYRAKKKGRNCICAFGVYE